MYPSPIVCAVRFPDCSRQWQLAVLTEFGRMILKRGGLTESGEWEFMSGLKKYIQHYMNFCLYENTVVFILPTTGCKAQISWLAA